MTQSCFLCAAAGGVPRAATDRPLRRVAGLGVVVAGAGALETGYVLIAPAHHHPDLATAISHDSSFIHFLEEALAEYLLLFGEYTYWEHGSAESNGRSSGCIAHAHLNVIPKQPLDNPDASGPLRDWRLLPESAYRPYLLLGGYDRIAVVGPDSMVVQHYRKQWATLVGRPDEWDYAAGGDIGALEETISAYEDGMST